MESIFHGRDEINKASVDRIEGSANERDRVFRRGTGREKRCSCAVKAKADFLVDLGYDVPADKVMRCCYVRGGTSSEVKGNGKFGRGWMGLHGF